MKRLAFVLALLFSAASLIADSRTGMWSAQLDNDTLHVNLMQPSHDGRFGQNNIGTNLRLTSLAGLAGADLHAAAADVHFTLTEAAGTIAFEGRFSNGLGAGNYHFTPSDAFVREMAAMGYDGGFSDDKMLLFTIEELRPQVLRDLRAMGYTIEKKQIDEIAIFKIDANYAKELASLGLATTTVRELVNLRIGRIDANFVRDMRAAGFDKLSPKQIADLGIMRVTPQYIRELKGAGLTSITPQQATNLKIGRITADKIAAYKRLGYDLTPSQLSDFGIHRVTPEFIEEMRSAGEKDLTPSHLIELKIFSRVAHRR
jgi:hypothetical protein